MSERFNRIFIESSLWENPKLMRFANLLKRNPTEAGGYLVRLWSWCGEYRSSGSLDALEDREVSSAGGWLGSPSKFVEALRKSGWLDGTQVHDWQDNQGKFFERMMKERARKRRGKGAEHPREFPPEGYGSGSVPVTVPKEADGLAEILATEFKMKATGSTMSREKVKRYLEGKLASGETVETIRAKIALVTDPSIAIWDLFERKQDGPRRVSQAGPRAEPGKYDNLPVKA